jgi:hypothetical protein
MKTNSNRKRKTIPNLIGKGKQIIIGKGKQFLIGKEKPNPY